MRIAPALLFVGALLAGAQQQAKKDNRPWIEILELKAERLEERIAIDGVLKNVGVRPIPELILLINLLDPGRKLISQRRGQLEQKLLEPGDEADFHFYVAQQARAAWISVEADSKRLADVGVKNGGPFPIE